MTPSFKDDPYYTVGTKELCAWAVAETVTWIQTRSPAIAKRVARQPDARRVAYSVQGGYLRTFSMPYTLSWVAKNVVAKLLSEGVPPKRPQIS